VKSYSDFQTVNPFSACTSPRYSEAIEPVEQIDAGDAVNEMDEK